jgi:uncharacterized MAPEG superfamily protein
MTIELRMLTFAVLLGVVQIVAASHAASLQRGYRWTASARDEAAPPLRGVAGRLDRALRNYMETFPLFAAVVLAAHVSGVHNALTVWGAQLYLIARVAYVLLYAAGVPLVRSLVWNVATVSILLFVIALFWT